MKIGVVGSGAFGSALAISLAKGGRDVALWGRSVGEMAETRAIPRLPGVLLPDGVHVTPDLSALRNMPVLLAVPTQTLGAVLADPSFPNASALIACCKGIELSSGRGPTAVIAESQDAPAFVLTGPSFAADIARGLPTALTLAGNDTDSLAQLQPLLSTDTLRIYTSDDPKGAELGGALKNVIAIASGMVMGAGLGESARAAMMTRGLAEMQRFAAHKGAAPATLMGLSGFGDLVLTCTSPQSRNYSYGFALGQGTPPDANKTVEGRATAEAALHIANAQNIDMPITEMVTAVMRGTCSLSEAVSALLARDLTKE